MIHECAFICGRIHYRGPFRLSTVKQGSLIHYYYEIYDPNYIRNGMWRKIGLTHPSRDVAMDNLMWYELGLLESNQPYA